MAVCAGCSHRHWDGVSNGRSTESESGKAGIVYQLVFLWLGHSPDADRRNQGGVDENTTVDYEFMDTKRFRTKESTEMFYTMLKYHLDHSDPYDVVIVGDDAALRFAMAFREDLFDGIPIVFEGVNDEEYALEAAKNPLVTGILEKLSVEKISIWH